MNVRALTVDDGAAWSQLRIASLETDSQAFGKAIEDQLAMTIAEIEARFRDVPDGGVHLGAFDGDALIGMVTFLRDSGRKERHKGHLYGMYVATSYRGQGIGRALIGTALDHARSQPGLEQVLIGVTSSQSVAQALYRRFGFRTYGIEPRAIRDGDIYLDEELMILHLRSMP